MKNFAKTYRLCEGVFRPATMAEVDHREKTHKKDEEKRVLADIMSVSRKENGMMCVCRTISLHGTELTSLKFIGDALGEYSVIGSFDVSWSNIMSLEGGPVEVDGDMNCTGIVGLRSLSGAPRTVAGNFHCNSCDLIGLEGGPANVGGNYDCSHNALYTLEGAPAVVPGSFRCHMNELHNLSGCPRIVGGDFWCYRNLTKFAPDYVKSLCQVRGKIQC